VDAVRVFTAAGRCVSISQKLAKQSQLLSQQLEWPRDDGEVPELFAPGVSQWALLSALEGSSCKGYGARELAEVLDAAEKLGVEVKHSQHLVEAFCAALKLCSCAGCCGRLGTASAPEPSCVMIDCWDNSRFSYWLDSVLRDRIIVSNFANSSIHAGRLDMFSHVVQRCKELDLSANLRWPHWRELLQSSALHLQDLREWIPQLLYHGLSIRNFMTFTFGSSAHTSMQQVLAAKVASGLSSRLSSAFPLHISKVIGPAITSVAKDRPKPDCDYAMKLLAKVLLGSLDQANTRRTAHLSYRSPLILWHCPSVLRLRLFNFVDGLIFTYPEHMCSPAHLWIGYEGRVLKEAVHDCRCSFKEVSLRQRAKMRVAKMQLQQYTRQVPRRLQQPRGHTTNVGRHPRGGQRMSRARGQR